MSREEVIKADKEADDACVHLGDGMRIYPTRDRLPELSEGVFFVKRSRTMKEVRPMVTELTVLFERLENLVMRDPRIFDALEHLRVKRALATLKKADDRICKVFCTHHEGSETESGESSDESSV